MPRYTEDLTGQTFGRLKVLSRAENKARNPMWFCLCECGVEKTVSSGNLRSKQTVSCGCYARDNARKFNRKHGHSAGGKISPTYSSHQAMLNRIFNKNDKDYPRYGGAGIRCCVGFRDFSTLLRILGERKPGTTLDRIKGRLHYSCGECEECRENHWEANCHWGTHEDQNNNRPGYNVIIDYNGKSLTVAQWHKETGKSLSMLYDRAQAGWTPEEIMETPIGTLHTYDGRTQTQIAWAKEKNINEGTLQNRLSKGWGITKALETPVRLRRTKAQILLDEENKIT